MAAFRAAEEPAGAVLDLSSPSLASELAELEGRLHVLGGLLDVSSRFHQVNETIQYARDRDAALLALQHEPFGYSHQQAEAILDMPMGWQSADEIAHLRDERDRLSSRRSDLREHVTEVFAFHWFG